MINYAVNMLDATDDVVNSQVLIFVGRFIEITSLNNYVCEQM